MFRDLPDIFGKHIQRQPLSPPPTPEKHQLISGNATQNHFPDKNVAMQKHTVSYSLGAVYKRLFGKEIPAAHSAEGDCMALLQIFHKESFACVNWIQKHAKVFHS